MDPADLDALNIHPSMGLRIDHYLSPSAETVHIALNARHAAVLALWGEAQSDQEG